MSKRITGNLNITSSSISNLNASLVSSANMVANSATCSNILTSNISTNNIITTTLNALNGITVGNLNLTGTLFQNGGAYASSQWTTTGANIFYTTGNVGINISSPNYRLDVNGNFRTTSGDVTLGTLLSTNSQLINANITSLTTSNIISTNISSATLNLSSGLTSGGAQLTNANVTNLTATTLLNTNAISTNISSATIVVTTLISSANITASLVTAGTALITNISNTNISSNTGLITNISNTALTTGTLRVTTLLSSANITANLITAGSGLLTNISNTNISSNTILATTLLSSANITANLVTAASGLLTNISNTNISSGTILATTLLSSANIAGSLITAGTARVTNVITSNFTVGNFTLDTINSTNIITTNFSTGSLILNSLNLGISSQFSGTFVASNNVTNANITGFLITSSMTSFEASLTALVVINSINTYENFNLSGIKTSTGWSLYISRKGSVTGISFSITTDGQLQYSSNISNWNSATFYYSINQINSAGTYTPISPTQSNIYAFNTVQITNTTDAISGSNVGGLNILGGTTINKNLVVSGSISGSANSNTLGSIITTGGNVGIGTINPTDKFVVNGGNIKVINGSYPSLVVSTGDSGKGDELTLMTNSTTPYESIIRSAKDLDIESPGNYKRISIKSGTGNVGIGTTAPETKLHVNGSIKLDGGYNQLSMIGGNSLGYMYGCFAKYGDGIHLGYNFYNDNSNNIIYNTGGRTSRLSLGYGYIGLYTGGANMEPTNLGLYQNEIGNVGIGTNNTIAKLNVSGTTLFQLPGAGESESNKNILELHGVATGTIEYNLIAAGHGTNTTFVVKGNGTVGIGTTTTNDSLTIRSGGIQIGGIPNTGSSGGYRLLRLTPFSGSATQITFDRSTSTGSEQNYIYSDNTIMELLAPKYNIAGGNVGIGINNPSSKLHVDGNVLIGQNAYTERLIPSSNGRINGVNITSLNKRTRTSNSTAIACVRTWTSRSSPNANSINNQADSWWQSVCWSPELSIFVAVSFNGLGNNVMTSPDGINWTLRSTPSNDCQSVCWSPELSLFVAVGGLTNCIMTSPDGINWTSRTAPANNYWRTVCWSSELSLFVAVSFNSSGNCVMTSPDGINWTARITPINGWFGLCWSPELSIFVAVSFNGTGNRVMTSPDGINWTLRNSAADNNWLGVCWSSELSLFVAVASSGTGNRVMTSPDGINWTLRTTPVDNQWYSVCWSQELSIFVAVSTNGTGNRVMTSPDGINWTTRTSAADNEWRSICWSPELSMFVAVSITGTGSRVMTSNFGLPAPLNTIKAPVSQLTITAAGNVGIGTDTPGVKLDVSGVGKFNTMLCSAGSNSLQITQDRLQFNSNYFYILNNNSIGVNLANGATSWGSQSDGRLKNIISPIEKAVSKIKQINPVIFSWKTDLNNTPHPGLIAQDIYNIQPEAVSIGEDSMMTVRYTELIPLAFAGLKEQQQIIDKQQENIIELNTKINEQQQTIDKLVLFIQSKFPGEF